MCHKLISCASIYTAHITWGPTENPGGGTNIRLLKKSTHLGLLTHLHVTLSLPESRQKLWCFNWCTCEDSLEWRGIYLACLCAYISSKERCTLWELKYEPGAIILPAENERPTVTMVKAVKIGNTNLREHVPTFGKIGNDPARKLVK